VSALRATLLLPVLLSVLLATGLTWLPTSARAAEPIAVLANDGTNEFPTKITFSLKAESAADVERATFYFHVGDSPVVTYARPDFQHSKQVQVEYVLDGKQDYLPPGSEINYYWLLEDAAGNKLKTEPASLVVVDTRYKWQTKTQGKIELSWYDGDEAFAQDLLDAGTKALDKLSRDAGVQVERPIKLLIYSSQKDLLGALEPKAQEWTGGRSFSELSIVLIAGSPSGSGKDFALRAVPHELSHVVIHQATENPYGDMPRWLDEGLAMSAEGDVETVYARALENAVREKKLISLQSLGSNFPADADEAALSYAESHSVVQFIIKTYGSDKMSKLLSVFREGSTYDDATKAALGLTIKELDVAWKKSLGVEVTPVGTSQAAPAGTVMATAATPTQAPSPTPQSPASQGQCGIALAAMGAVGLAIVKMRVGAG
jgi:hypothetical protein